MTQIATRSNARIFRPSAGALLAAAVLVLAAAGCVTTPGPTVVPGTSPTAAPLATAGGPTVAASPVPSAEPSPGFFAFDAESIVGYYASIGYTCADPQPSTQASGYAYRSCLLADDAGRMRVVGVVTDAAGDVADAFASVTGAQGEDVLDPAAVLEPFAAFLGAMLGESQGESLLPWLAGHLGDAYTTTMLGDLTIATYSETPDDHSKLYVEIANPGYLEAPRPSPTP